MRLSQRADYAAHAMVEIARWYGERPVHATEIAQRQGIPEPYLEQLLLALRRAALVRSYRGPGGGYTLTRPPGAISLADVVAALEGPFVPPEESLHDAESSDADPLTCPIRDAWHLATATMRRILDGLTLEVLVQRQREIDRQRGVARGDAAGAAPPGAALVAPHAAGLPVGATATPSEPPPPAGRNQPGQ